MRKMQVDSVRINLQTQQRMVILRTEDQSSYLFIWIAQSEAQAIAMELQQIHSPRPLTHDLLKNIIEGTGLTTREVRITRLEEEIFYAEIVLEHAGQELVFDARPSDTLALAVRTRAPIFVAESVLQNRGFTQEQHALETGHLENPSTEQVAIRKIEINELEQLRQENARLQELLRKTQKPTDDQKPAAE